MMILLSFVVFQSAYGQQVQSLDSRQPGYWSFGINAGFAYQQSDIPATPDGFGLGLTLGKNLFYTEKAPFSLDWRGRLLYAETYGLGHERFRGLLYNESLNGIAGPDYSASPGYIYENHHTVHGELAMEAELNFEHLRRQNNIHLSFYGGLGLNYYRTKIDQLQGSERYEYSAVSASGSVAAIKANLRNDFLDGEYETVADGFTEGIGQINWMPSIGLELGYWFTPRFAVFAGHRLTFARTDLLDGQQWNNENLPTGNQDRYHYTNLGLRWLLQQDKNLLLSPPIIEVLQPLDPASGNPSGTALIKAKIKNIAGPSNVRYYLNSQKAEFDYFKERFSAMAALQPGKNEIIIIATNAAGQNREEITIYYDQVAGTTATDEGIQQSDQTEGSDEPVQAPSYPAPEVRITKVSDPVMEADQLDQCRTMVRAILSNVTDRSAIRLLVNGKEESVFSYEASRGLFESEVMVSPGRQQVVVEARTTGGRAKDVVTVTCKQPVTRAKPPRVTINLPRDKGSSTSNPRALIQATVEEISQKENIALSINSRPVRQFIFDPHTQLLTADVQLTLGSNRIVLAARNQAGRDDDFVDIQYIKKDDPPKSPPVISIREPQRESQHHQPGIKLRAMVENLHHKSAITLTVNGRNSTSFLFNPATGKMYSELKLREGKNIIVVKGKNKDGEHQDSRIVYYQPPVKPELSFLQPSLPGQVVYSDRQFIRVKVAHIESKEQLEVLLNGKMITDYDLDGTHLSATLVVARGTNNIAVKAENKAGKALVETKLHFRGRIAPINHNYPQKPEIIIKSLSRPTTNPLSPNHAQSRILATIRYVQGKNSIQIRVNGKEVDDFSFKGETGALEAQIILQRGDNEIVIKAVNRSGSSVRKENLKF